MSDRGRADGPIERPRILIDAIAYSPRDGGFTTALHDLLVTCGRLTEFQFVIVHARKHQEYFRSFGLGTYAVPAPNSVRFFASLLLLPFITRRTHATAVHCEISALPWFAGVPGSVTVHDLYFLLDPRVTGRSVRRRVMGAYWRHVFVRSIRRARIVKSVSRTTAEDLQRLVSPDLPILVCEPRFDEPLDLVGTRQLPGPGEDLRLLFVGSVIPRKNLRFLLRSLRHVRRPWHLDVVGNLWWGAGALETMSSDGRVKVHGFLPDSGRDRLIADAHLLVVPSHYEGFGYPAAEAMVRGLPALTSDVGAFREFVPADWRFPLGDPSFLASMIDDLDERAYRDMPGIARQAVARFSPAAHLERHRQLMDRLRSSLPTVPDGPNTPER